MYSFRTLVVPVDFHEHSETLAAFALELGRKLDAGTTFIHVSKHLPDHSDYIPSTLEQVGQNLRALAGQKMEAFIAKWRAEGYDCSGAVLEGEVAEAIIAYARERAADLIIISSHGAQGIEKILLGSVADQVIKGASCPTLVFNPFSKERGYEVCSPLNECMERY